MVQRTVYIVHSRQLRDHEPLPRGRIPVSILLKVSIALGRMLIYWINDTAPAPEIEAVIKFGNFPSMSRKSSPGAITTLNFTHFYDIRSQEVLYVEETTNL